MPSVELVSTIVLHSCFVIRVDSLFYIRDQGTGRGVGKAAK